MSTLYEIKGEFLTLMDMLEELEELELDKNVDPQLLADQRQLVSDTLEGVKGELEAKAEGYIAVRNEFKAQAQIFKQEKEKWANKEAVAKKSLARLEQTLLGAMIELKLDDKDGLDTGFHTIKVVNNGGVQPLKIDIPVEQLPKKFQKITIAADNDKIREMLSQGEKVAKRYPWAHLEPRGRRLSIK